MKVDVALGGVVVAQSPKNVYATENERPAAAGQTGESEREAAELKHDQSNAISTPASRPQLAIDRSVKALLAQLTQSRAARNDLLSQLPPVLRAHVEQLLSQTLADQNIRGGLAVLLKGQTGIGEQLKSLAYMLQSFASGSTGAGGSVRFPAAAVALLSLVEATASFAKADQPAAAMLLKLAGQLADPQSEQQAVQTVRQLWQQSPFAASDKPGQVFAQLVKQLSTVQQQQTPSESDAAQMPTAATAAQNGAKASYGAVLSSLKQQGAAQLSAAADQPRPAVSPAGVGQMRMPQAGELLGRRTETANQPASAKQAPQLSTGANEDQVVKLWINKLAQSILIIKPSQITAADAVRLQQLTEAAGQKPGSDEAGWSNISRLLKANIEAMPTAVRAASVKAPELSQMWALQQMSTMVQFAGLPPRVLDNTSKLLEQLARTLKGALTSSGEMVENQRSATFTIPLYFADSQQSYPAFVHAYHLPSGSDGEAGDNDGETWLRICLETENAGAVDLTFRLYQQHHLNLRVGMGDPDAVQLFQGMLPEIKTAIETTPLVLSEVSICSAGADR